MESAGHAQREAPMRANRYCTFARDVAGARDVLAVGAWGPQIALSLAGVARCAIGIGAQADMPAARADAAPNAILASASASALPLADASVDVAMAFGLSGGGESGLFAELGRVLRPDGILMFSFARRMAPDAQRQDDGHALAALHIPEVRLAGEFHVHAAVRLRVEAGTGVGQRTNDAADLPEFVFLACRDARAPALAGGRQVLETMALAWDAPAKMSGAELAGTRQAVPETTARELGKRVQRMLSDQFRRQARIEELERQVADMERSRSWRLTAPLRHAMHRARNMKKWFFFVSQRWRRKVIRKLEATAGRRKKLILFVTHSLTDPGHVYRVERLRKALPPQYETRLTTLEELWAGRAPHFQADLVWLWRTPLEGCAWSALREAKAAGAIIVFDVDDMCFHPDHFTVENMDALRSQCLDIGEMRQYGMKMMNAAALADLRVAPTLPLMQRLVRHTKEPSTILRNTFDHEYRIRCVSERAGFLGTKTDNFCRIGYAAGTRTHQADLAPIVPALAAVLRRNPQARLVLFSSIDIWEMPELESVRDQIEIRELTPLADLPRELARFDINIVPLQVENPFCNCKSELKFFEAALMRVPTIASPTQPFCAAIRHGITGYLAQTPEEWAKALDELLADAQLRDKIGAAAQRSVLWKYGPEYLGRRGRDILEYACADPCQKTRLFNALLEDDRKDGATVQFELTEYEVVFQKGQPVAPVSVVIPLYNYEKYIVEALDSVLAQTLEELDVIVVNDCSTDNSQEIARDWLQKHSGRFHSVALLRNLSNSGLSVTRNVGIDFSESEFILLLDADNQLLPDCAARCLELMRNSDAGFAYPHLQAFGDEDYIFSDRDWDPMLLRHGNYIDALSMIRKACWAAVGGYSGRIGWEDYELWCKFVERGFWGIQAGTVLARYRVHNTSMRYILTDVQETRLKLERSLAEKHEWLMLRAGHD